MKQFVNNTGSDLTVYADSDMTRKVGLLYPGSVCQCIMEQDEQVVVLYRVHSTGVLKVGFTDHLEGVIS